VAVADSGRGGEVQYQLLEGIRQESERVQRLENIREVVPEWSLADPRVAH
jgi:hypothetical protein